MQVIEVQFENIGNAAMSKIHLIHHSPGMFSFGTPSQGKRKDTLFDLPLHSESFCLMKCTQLFSLQILGLQPRISKFFLTVGQNNFGNKIPFAYCTLSFHKLSLLKDLKVKSLEGTNLEYDNNWC